MLTESGRPERSSVDRTIDILSSFDHGHRSLTLTDISRRSGLPVATVYRMVVKLHGRGVLERTADGKYSIGLQLWEIGSLAPRGSVLRETALPHLAKLHTQIGATVTLTVRDHTDVVCLEMISVGTRCFSPPARPGSRAPLHTNAAGLVLLAHASAAVREEVCSHHRPQHSTHGEGLRNPALQDLLDQVRRQGYAITSPRATGARAVAAAPVRAGGDAVIAAIDAVADIESPSGPELASWVLATADAISRQLAASAQKSTDPTA